MSEKATSPLVSLAPEKLDYLIAGFRLFFSGETLEDIREHLEMLQETTVTESYGDLDKEDKWQLIILIKRLNQLALLGYEFLEYLGEGPGSDDDDEDDPEGNIVTRMAA